jgi:hypothetical protein
VGRSSTVWTIGADGDSRVCFTSRLVSLPATENSTTAGR